MKRCSAGFGLMLVLVGLGAGEDPASAADLRAGSPALAALAQSWQADPAGLLTRLADPDARVRRGAARLCAGAGIAPAALLPVLRSSTDAEVVRLASPALRPGLATLAMADLVALADGSGGTSGTSGGGGNSGNSNVAVVCLLLNDHPAPLAEETLRRRLAEWLAEPASAGPAAVLIVARGTAAEHGALLVEVVASAKDSEVVAIAHHALEQLTRTQRGLAAYAGHHDLLAKDWRDVLAAKVATGTAGSKVETEIQTLIADLPRAEALAGLLALGSGAKADGTVAAALQAAAAGAPKERRRELATAARLVDRAVSPRLWQQLGPAGFDQMDAAEPAKRLECLRAIATAVTTLKDADGPMHLLRWADDDDPRVRTAAFDRLVRLSDDAEELKVKWRFDQSSSDGPPAFHQARAIRRIRTSLREGSVEEQLAAMLFAVTLKAKDLRTDVAPLLLSTQPAVVDSALESLGHLGVEATDTPILTRLAADMRQPAVRRAKAIERLATVAEQQRGEENPTKNGIHKDLLRLSADPDPFVAQAAAKAVINAERGAQRTALLRRMITDGKAGTALGLLRRNWQDGDGDLVRPLVLGSDQAVARVAAELLVERLDARGRRAGPATADTAFPAALATVATHNGPAQAARTALAVMLGTLPPAKAEELLASAGESDRTILWRALIHATPWRIEAVTTLVQLANTKTTAGQALDGSTWQRLLHRARSMGALFPARLALIAEHQDLHVLQVQDTETKHRNDERHTTLTLDAQTKVELVGRKRKRADQAIDPDEDDRNAGLDWSVAPWPGTPSGESCAALVRALQEAQVSKEVPKDRSSDLALAIVFAGGPLEAAADLSHWDHDTNAWALAMRFLPEARPRLVAAINAKKSANFYELRRFLVPQNPDLLPALDQMLNQASRDLDESDAKKIVRWLASLDPKDRSAFILSHANHSRLMAQAGFLDLLRQGGPLPQAAALALLRAGLLGEQDRIAPVTDAETLGKDLAALTAAEVVQRAPALRQLRLAGPAAFDAALAGLIAKRDDVAAAWLRTGIPLAAGQRQAYLDALESPNGELWLAGAALALKEGRLDAAAFLARCATLPAGAQGFAATVAERYLAGKLAPHAEALAAIARTAPVRVLVAWMHLMPPAAPIEAVLAERVADASVARSLAPAFAAALRTDRDRWLPILQRLLPKANGRLDFLLPASQRLPPQEKP